MEIHCNVKSVFQRSFLHGSEPWGLPLHCTILSQRCSSSLFDEHRQAGGWLSSRKTGNEKRSGWYCLSGIVSLKLFRCAWTRCPSSCEKDLGTTLAKTFLYKLHTSTLPDEAWMNDTGVFVPWSVKCSLCKQPETIDHVFVYSWGAIFIRDISCKNNYIPQAIPFDILQCTELTLSLMTRSSCSIFIANGAHAWL